MLLNSYEIEVSLPACNPSALTLRAEARLSDDISEVLPYLNALVKGGVFDPAGCTLRFSQVLQQGRRSFTIYPHSVLIGGAADAGEARDAMDWLKDFINETYDRRQSMEPSYRRGIELNPLQLYRLLPATNCKECGEATCMAFAGKLLKEEIEIISCKPLFRPEQQEKRERLLALLEEVGRT